MKSARPCGTVRPSGAPLVARLTLLLTLACHDTSEPIDPADSSSEADTPGSDSVDTVVETDVGDSDGGDSDVDPVDTPEVPLVAPELGQGFVDLTTALYATWPRDTYGGVYPLPRQPDLSHGLFADLDHDGRPEVVLVGTGANANALRTIEVLRYDPLDDTLRPDAALTRRLAAQDPLLLGLVDLDGDGHLDVLPGRSDNPPIRGRADDSFDLPRERLAYDPGLLSGTPVDLDHDGWTDLVRVAGGCRDATPWNVWMRTGATTWTEQRVAVVDVASSPYAAGIAYFSAGPAVLAIGLGCEQTEMAPVFYTPEPTVGEQLAAYVAADLTPSDSAYKLDPYVAGGPMSRVNPMGAAVADLDGDQDLDLAVATVFHSVLVFEDEGTFPLRDATTARQAVLPDRLSDGSPGPYEWIRPWGIAALDLDRDGSLDLIVVGGNDTTSGLVPPPGSDATLTFFRRGSRYLEASTAAGLGTPYEGHSITVGDLDLDGRPDVILGGHGTLPRVLLNRLDGPRPALGLRLVGTSSGDWPHGATAMVEDGGVTSPLQMVGGVISPGPTSEPIVFATTDADGVADLVTVRWPSGVVQEVRGLTAGTTHTLVEPETLSLTPASRHVRADATSAATLHITPRAADGSARAANVVVTVHGPGTASTATASGDGYDVEVRSEVAGEARVDVIVDGVTMDLHPRIWWDP